MILLVLPLFALIAALGAYALFGNIDEEEMKQGFVRENDDSYAQDLFGYRHEGRS